MDICLISNMDKNYDSCDLGVVPKFTLCSNLHSAKILMYALLYTYKLEGIVPIGGDHLLLPPSKNCLNLSRKLAQAIL